MKILRMWWFLLLIWSVNVCSVNSYSANITVNAVNRNQLEENLLRKLNVKCAQRENHSCMMLKLIVYMNRIFRKPSIDIYENLRLTQNRRGEVLDVPGDDILLSRAIGFDNEALGLLIAEKIRKFIQTRTLRYKVYKSADIVLSSEPEGKLHVGLSISPSEVLSEGRGKIKNIGIILAAVATKIAILGALIIKGLLLLTGKALLVSKAALVVAVTMGLKRLLSKKRVIYEAIPHSHHTHESSPVPYNSYSSGWARAFDGFLEGLAEVPAKAFDAQSLAFAEQKPKSL